MTNQEFSERLRAIARAYEANPEAKQLYDIRGDGKAAIYCHDKVEVAATIRAFGPGVKSDDGDCIRYFPENFPEITIIMFKNGVCDRVLVEIKEIPETVLPARPAEPERVIPAHTEEVWEWKCGPLLDGGSE